jgi:hypothetical protein
VVGEGEVMAMIEIQDLRAPWTSKTNIISMVLAIALFAAFRISGGGLGLNIDTRTQNNSNFILEDENQVPSSLGQWENDDGSMRDKRSKTERPASNDSSGFIAQDDGFDPLAGTGQESGSEQEEEGGFDEIERELGLR